MSFFNYFFSPFQSKISINELDSNDSKCNDIVVRNKNLNVDAFFDEAEDSNATTVTITNRLLESNVLRVLGEESIESSVSEEVAVIDDSDSVNFNDMSNSFNSELFSSGNYKYILKGVPIDQSKKSIQNALKACISADHRLYNLLTTITVEYFLYNLADGSLCNCGNFAKFLNHLAKLLIVMMDFPKASPMKSNFSRKVFTQNSKLAEVIILLYFQMSNYSNLSYSSVSALPEIWRAFIDYLRNESITDEIGNLFISRFSQVNKNKKLITKAKDNQAIQFIDIHSLIVYQEKSQGLMEDIKKVFQNVYLRLNKTTGVRWKYSEKYLKSYLQDVLSNGCRRSMLNHYQDSVPSTSCNVTPASSHIDGTASSLIANLSDRRHSQKISTIHMPILSHLVASSRFIERLQSDPIILTAFVDEVMPQLMHLKQVYEEKKIISVDLKELFGIVTKNEVNSRRFSNDLCDELVVLLELYSASVIDLYGNRVDGDWSNKTKSIVIKNIDINNFNFLEHGIGQAVLFLHDLFLKLCYNLCIIPRNAIACSYSGEFNKFDTKLSSPGCLDGLHWKYKVPPEFSDEFVGAIVYINPSSKPQFQQVHRWRELEYVTKRFALQKAERKPYSFTLVDARLLHSESHNMGADIQCNNVIYIDPVNFDYSQERVVRDLITEDDRINGLAMKYSGIEGTGMVLVEKERAIPQEVSDTISMIKNCRENLISHINNDIALEKLDWHINSVVDSLENSINSE